MELIKELQRVFARKGNTLKRVYKCPSGPRKGKKVVSLVTCFKKKARAKTRLKLRLANIKHKAVRIRKSKIARRQPMHFKLVRLNKMFRTRR